MSEVKSTIYQRGDGQMIVTTGPKTCCFGSKRTAAEFIAMYQEELLSATARLAAAEARNKSDYDEACYLFKCVAPQCTVMEHTSGVLSQLNNFMAGQSERLAESVKARDERESAARWCHKSLYQVASVDALERWPWLVDEAAKGGRE